MKLILLIYPTTRETLHKRESHEELNNHLGEASISLSPQQSRGGAGLKHPTAPVLLASQEPWAVLEGPPASSESDAHDWGSVLATWTGGAAKSAKSATSMFDRLLVTHLGIICFYLSVFFSCTYLVILCIIMPPVDLMLEQGKLGTVLREKTGKLEARMSWRWSWVCRTNVCHNQERLEADHLITAAQTMCWALGMQGPLNQVPCL